MREMKARIHHGDLEGVGQVRHGGLQRQADRIRRCGTRCRRAVLFQDGQTARRNARNEAVGAICQDIRVGRVD
jgi:hypothetical protein